MECLILSFPKLIYLFFQAAQWTLPTSCSENAKSMYVVHPLFTAITLRRTKAVVPGIVNDPPSVTSPSFS